MQCINKEIDVSEGIYFVIYNNAKELWDCTSPVPIGQQLFAKPSITILTKQGQDCMQDSGRKAYYDDDDDDGGGGGGKALLLLKTN